MAKKLVSALINLLGTGGTLFIGNVSKKNPDRFSMNYFMEWNLVLRDEADMLNLVDTHNEFSEKVKCEVVSESLGLNLFLKVTKVA